MDDEPTHRRRSSSLVFAAGTKHGSTAKQSPANGHIPEESDAASSSDVEMDHIHTGDELTDDEETGLTHTQRKKRRRRKRRSTQLDERIVSGEDKARVGGELARASIVREYAINAVLIGLWYSFSISISVYNKWMFSKDNLDFHFPLFTTSLHMIVQFSLASLVLFFLPQFRPKAGAVDPHAQGYSQIDGNEETADHNARQNPSRPAEPQKESSLMTKWFYITRIGPCGTATALDIGLGNFSLRFISLTFFTMCKSSVLAFVLLFAFLFRLESPSWRLLAIITLMTGGVIMMVAGETAFNALGFILVMSASFCSGFRWSLTQILLLRNPATSNPFSSIFFLTPVMFLALLVLALPIEGPTALAAGFQSLIEAKGLLLGIAIMLFPGFLAFLMVAAEFALLKRTSVVTLSVCGIFKEVLTISAAGIVFGDNLTPINISGLLITILSIALYNYLKYSKMRREAEKKAQQMLETDGGIADNNDDDHDEVGATKTLERFSEADDAVGKESTSSLVRGDLAGDVLMPPLINPKSNGALGHGRAGSLSQSPIKRPEDVE